jgi:hypothetical protein
MEINLEHPVILSQLNNYLSLESRKNLRICSKLIRYFIYDRICLCNHNHHYNCNCNCSYCNSFFTF